MRANHAINVATEFSISDFILAATRGSTFPKLKRNSTFFQVWFAVAKLNPNPTIIEEVTARFPHLGEQIFQQLDYQNLVRCKMVSRSWLSCVEEQNFYYIQLIKAFTNCSDELLKNVLQKSKLEAVIELAYDVFNVYTKPKEIFNRMPIHEAAENGLFDVCQLSIDEFSNPMDENWQTPLHLASANGHLSICQLILDANTDKDEDFNTVESLRDKNGQTPLHFAAKNGHQAICDLLIKNIATFKGEDEMPLTLFELGDEKGVTPLHMSAENGHLEISQLIFNQSVFNNLEFEDGDESDLYLGFGDYKDQTPLHLAAKNGHLEVCQLIMNNVGGAQDMTNRVTPLRLAVENNRFEVCKLLIENMQEKECFGSDSLLHLSASKGHLQTFDWTCC